MAIFGWSIDRDLRLLQRRGAPFNIGSRCNLSFALPRPYRDLIPVASNLIFSKRCPLPGNGMIEPALQEDNYPYGYMNLTFCLNVLSTGATS
jgi:hypothetical protein